ncbi:MFS transporter [uncultured Limosilactobacillus sp.]|uniref:MFS transporter n=1 Tax=uncultured Limosilactobacillus sp. TaxID=2837629 RepID=UPI0025F91B69|nr:MFS transporter [uncultured Limosilactobacillus sp.]
MKRVVAPRVLVAILSAGMLSFLGILDETATTVTFPTLIREFAVTTDQVQWVNTLVLLVIATIVPLSSQIRLRLPTKRIFLLGIGFFMLGLVIDIVAWRFDLLLLGRALQGIGTGIGLPLMYNIILTKVPKEQLGLMMGIGTMITAAAVAFGPVFGGLMTDLLNWRWIFIISAVLAVIAAGAGAYSMPQLVVLEKRRFKLAQWLSIAGGLVFLMVGFTNIARHQFWSVAVSGLLIVGILALVCWFLLSWHDPQALISPRLFTNTHFSMQLLCYCFAKVATLALGFLLPLYVEEVNHGAVSLAGWVIFPGAVMDALLAAAAGKMLDKWGARLPILVGTIASLVSLTLMTIAARQLSNLMIVALYVVYYGGYGMSFSSLMTSGLTSLTAASHAQGNAIFNTLQQFAGAAGTALAGTFVAMSQNQSQTSAAGVATGTKWTLWLLTGLLVANLVLTIIFVPRGRKDSTNATSH